MLYSAHTSPAFYIRLPPELHHKRPVGRQRGFRFIEKVVSSQYPVGSSTEEGKQKAKVFPPQSSALSPGGPRSGVRATAPLGSQGPER